MVGSLGMNSGRAGLPRSRRAIHDGRSALPAPPAFDGVLSVVTPQRMLDAYDVLYAEVLA